MQRVAIALLLSLSACSKGSDAGRDTAGAMIQCAVGEAQHFAPVCTLERTRDKAGDVLIVRHPNGGFRRFTVLPEGKGLASADGADVAVQQLSGDLLEVRVGADRYRFPIVAKTPDAGR